MRIYVAGVLISEAERAWLDGLAARLREEGFDCFVPHEQFSELKELTPAEVFRVDTQGLATRTSCSRGSTGLRSTTARHARSACSPNSRRAATRATTASSAS